jgi:hypothetical protein
VSKGSTIADWAVKERCAICKARTEDMLIHLATHHRGVTKHGEIFWMNRHEAIYKDRTYGNGTTLPEPKEERKWT